MAGIGRFQHTGAAPQTNLSVSMGSGDTSFTAASGTGYPDGSVGNFVIAVDPGTPSEEKILCSSRSGAVFTVAGSGRGYDNTSAVAHTAPTALVEHVVAATEIDDASRHINPSLLSVYSDDHVNYALVSGSRAFTGAVTVSSGGLTVTAGGLTVSAGGAAITGAISSTSTDTATAQIATLTGTNGRFVGNTNGAPSSGTYSTGDFAMDPTNRVMWICTAGGTPGTWSSPNGGNYRARVYMSSSFNITSGGEIIKFDTKTGTGGWDPTGSYSTSTGLFTCPVAGYYRVSTILNWNGGSSTVVAFIIQNNVTLNANVSSANINTAISLNDEVLCAAGDTLQIFCNNGGGTTTLATGSLNSSAVFEKVG